MRDSARAIVLGLTAAASFLAAAPVVAGDEMALVGSYALTRRVGKDGKDVTASDVVGFMTFTKTRRTVIMRWKDTEGKPVSISFIAGYTLANGKYCENVIYGVQSNLVGPGVVYDPPSDTPACNAATTKDGGVAFDVPNERLRLQFTGEGFIATTLRWTDYWEKVK